MILQPLDFNNQFTIDLIKHEIELYGSISPQMLTLGNNGWTYLSNHILEADDDGRTTFLDRYGKSLSITDVKKLSTEERKNRLTFNRNLAHAVNTKQPISCPLSLQLILSPSMVNGEDYESFAIGKWMLTQFKKKKAENDNNGSLVFDDPKTVNQTFTPNSILRNLSLQSFTEKYFSELYTRYNKNQLRIENQDKMLQQTNKLSLTKIKSLLFSKDKNEKKSKQLQESIEKFYTLDDLTLIQKVEGLDLEAYLKNQKELLEKDMRETIYAFMSLIEATNRFSKHAIGLPILLMISIFLIVGGLLSIAHDFDNADKFKSKLGFYFAIFGSIVMTGSGLVLAGETYRQWQEPTNENKINTNTNIAYENMETQRKAQINEEREKLDPIYKITHTGFTDAIQFIERIQSRQIRGSIDPNNNNTQAMEMRKKHQ